MRLSQLVNRLLGPSDTRGVATSDHSIPVRLVMLVASWTGVSVGVPLLLRGQLGVAPFDVFNTGLSDAINSSFGTAFSITAFSLYFIGRLLGGQIGWGSLLGTVIIGPMLNVVLGVMPEPEALPPRIGLLLLGIVVLALAVSFGIVADFGVGPGEVFMLGLIRRGVGVVPARWITDGLPLVLGVMLGGAVGIGTVIFGVALGPLIKLALTRLGYTPRTIAPARS